MDTETVARVLGCSGTNASITIVSALTEYGLLESVGEQLRVTEDAVNIIIHEQGHPVRVRALKNVAFTPYLFSKLQEAFGEEPPNDNLLRSFLLKEGFSTKTIGNVIRDYRQTLMFLRSELLVSNVQNIAQQYLSNENTNFSYPASQVDEPLPLMTPGSFGQTLVYRIAENCSVRIEFDGPVAREGIEKLIALLELNADAFPKQGAEPQRKDSRLGSSGSLRAQAPLALPVQASIEW